MARRLLAMVVLAAILSGVRADDQPMIRLPELPGQTLGAAPVLGSEASASPTAPLSPLSPTGLDLRPDREPVRGSSTNAGLLGSLTSQQTVRDGDAATNAGGPLTSRGWQADQAWKLGVLGPVFVFGQATAAAEDSLQQDMHVTGRTGLGCQVPLPIGELLLRGGTNTTYSDLMRSSQAKERSELLVEVQGRCPLLFGINLEYDGTACPSLSPLERDWVSQELRFALSVGSSCKLKLGARQRWENVAEQRATTDGTQLFLGVELKH